MRLLLVIDKQQQQLNAMKAMKATILIEYFKLLKNADSDRNHQQMFVTQIVKK